MNWTPNEQQKLKSFSLRVQQIISQKWFGLTKISPWPTIFPLYNRRRTGSFYIFVLSPDSTECAAALVLFLLTQENFCSVIYSLVVLINSTTTENLRLFFHFCLSIYWKKNARWFIWLSSPLTSLPPSSTFSSCLHCSTVFALFSTVLQCTGKCFGCSRLDCYTDIQWASKCFLFVWHEQYTPQTSILYI